MKPLRARFDQRVVTPGHCSLTSACGSERCVSVEIVGSVGSEWSSVVLRELVSVVGAIAVVGVAVVESRVWAAWLRWAEQGTWLPDIRSPRTVAWGGRGPSGGVVQGVGHVCYRDDAHEADRDVGRLHDAGS